MSSDSPPSQASVLESAEARHIQTPHFGWDWIRLGPCCSVQHIGRTLCNKVSSDPILREGMHYNFPGTRGTLPLTGKNLVYWEVDWFLSKHGSLKRGDESLVKLGVATEDVLATAMDGTDLETQNEAGITVGIDALPNSTKHFIWARCGPRNERRIRIAMNQESEEPEDKYVSLRFLFDGPKSTVYVLQKQKPHLLWKSPVDVKKPLYPFACLSDYDTVKKEMSVRLKCSLSIELSKEERHYLQDLTRADGFLYSALSTPEFKWDPTTIGPGCSLADEDKSVSNNPVSPNAAPVRCPFKFPGTRALINLDIEDVVYWELWWFISPPESWISTNYQSGPQRLLQLGIAPCDVLFDFPEDAHLEKLNTAGVTLLVEEDQEKMVVRVTGGPAQQEPEKLEGFPCDIKGSQSLLGFLFDGSRSTLWVTNAWTNKVLMKRKVNIVRNLNPFVCVGKSEVVGKSIVVILNFEDLGMNTKALIRQLLHDSE